MRRALLLSGLVSVLCTPCATAQDAPQHGYTQPSKEIRLAFADVGVLRELRVREGDRVAAGQVLARLDTSVLEAEAEMARAQADLATRRLASLKKIAERARVSPDELARAEAEAAIEEARVKRVIAQIERRTLRSPVGGLVTLVAHTVGENVAPPDLHVLTMVVLKDLHANLYVKAEAALNYKRDMSVDLIYDGKKPIRGKVAFVSPIVEPASGTVRILVVIPNAKGELRSGIRVGLRREDETAASSPTPASP